VKTNSAARRVWELRTGIACVAITALASFDLWAVGYCCRNSAKTSTHQTGTQQVWNASVTGSEVFLAIR
jgi:hypothetical protein